MAARDLVFGWLSLIEFDALDSSPSLLDARKLEKKLIGDRWLAEACRARERKVWECGYVDVRLVIAAIWKEQ